METFLKIIPYHVQPCPEGQSHLAELISGMIHKMYKGRNDDKCQYRLDYSMYGTLSKTRATSHTHIYIYYYGLLLEPGVSDLRTNYVFGVT